MRYDVAVIGAGPSGAWTATLLARRGARVALIDASHPREKPCGGGVTGRALALISGVVPRERVTAVPVRQARFVEASTARSVAVALEAQSNPALSADRGQPLVVASRTDFDGALFSAAESAGAEIVQARCSGMTVEQAEVQLDLGKGRRLTASSVVGADGANSLVRRRLARPFGRDQISIATGFFAHGVTSDEIVIEITSDPPGYIWSFPRADHLAIGICAQADAGVGAERLRMFVRSWIETTGIARGARLQPYSWPIPSLSARDFHTLEVSGPRWLTVGDAAGLVDPITREGIFFALHSAQIAADALSDDPARADHVYRDRVRTEIGAELARAARYKSGFFKPGFARLLMDALTVSPNIRAVMADLVAGTQCYRDLKWRLAKTMEIGLAWRLVTQAVQDRAM